MTGHKQTTDGQQYTTGYSYNLAGALIEETYPSGRVVKNVLDNSGDLSIVESRKNASSGYWHYADAFTYNAAGAVTAMQLGNGRWESTTFNSRLQPTQIALGTTQGTTDKLKLEYGYGTTANNGNVLSQTITVPTVGSDIGFAAVQTYTYDELNRLKSATENLTPNGGSQVQTWKQTYTFDRYGNRRFDFTGGSTTFPNPSCTEAVCNPTVSTSNNRLTSAGWLYDAAGNTTRDGGYQTFAYDAENKQLEVKNSSSVTLGQYWYDGDGKRVKKIVPATGEVTVFVYDAAGKLVAEYSTNVESAEDAKVAYLTTDHLGSPRINTDATGRVSARHDYHPFGEEIITSQRASHGEYTPDSIRKQFTGYERDYESDLDYAINRYYNGSHGRFTSPDTLLSSGRVENTQTWNRYAYVLGNPLRYSDPLGLFEWDETAGGSATDEELQARSTDKTRRKKERKVARKALDFRNKFRAARGQAIQAASNPNLTEEQRTRILSSVGSYGDENDHNGVFVAVKSKLGTGIGASTELRDDGSILVSFRENAKAKGLAIDIAHEGQHVYDADQFLSYRFANGETDLTQYDRERRAYEITSFVAQGLSQSYALKGFEAKYLVWNKGWKGAEVADKRSKGIDRLISNYYGYDPATNTGKKYSEEFNPGP